MFFSLFNLVSAIFCSSYSVMRFKMINVFYMNAFSTSLPRTKKSTHDHQPQIIANEIDIHSKTSYLCSPFYTSTPLTLNRFHKRYPCSFRVGCSLGRLSINLTVGSRDSRGSRDSASIEVLSAPTSPVEHGGANSSQHIIGRNPLRGSKCKDNCGYTSLFFLRFLRLLF